MLQMNVFGEVHAAVRKKFLQFSYVSTGVVFKEPQDCLFASMTF